MRKADIVQSISEKTGIPRVNVLVALESFFKEVKTNLSNGEPVFVRGFGSFILQKRAAKIGRDITRNQTVEIPEHFIPKFKPAKEWMQDIRENTKQYNESAIEE